MRNRPFNTENGTTLQWHPGSLIWRVMENKTEGHNFKAVLLLKWLIVTNYKQDEKCDKMMEILTNDEFGGK